MGGAFCAVADDSSAIYYNPAGMSAVKGREFAVSNYAYSTSETKYKKAINSSPFVESEQGWTPGYVGGFYPIGGLSVGYAIFSLDSRQVNQDDKFEDITPESELTAGSLTNYRRTKQENHQYQIYAVGAGLSITKALSLGVTGFGYKRDLVQTEHQMVRFQEFGVTFTDSKLSLANRGMGFIFGALWDGKEWSFGYTYRFAQQLSNTVDLRSDRSFPSDGSVPVEGCEVFSNTVYCQTDWSQDEIQTFKELNPSEYRFGLGYRPSKTFLVAFDILYHEGRKFIYKEPDTGRKFELTRHTLHDVLNVSIGSEMLFGPMVVRAGAFTNFSMLSSVKSNEVSQLTKIDYFGCTAGFGVVSKSGSYTLGGTHQIGQGKAQIISGDRAIQEVEATRTSISLAISQSI